MKIERLYCANYRNIECANFVPAPELTIICGENGQGKTNLLEAVWLLTGAKSFRGTKDNLLIKEFCDIAKIESEILKDDEISTLELSIFSDNMPKKGRYAKINGVDYGRASSIAGKYSAVVFSPEHLDLVKSSPSVRRKFIDIALGQLYISYVPLLRKYTRLLAQKNAVLKKYHHIPNAKQLLDVYDQSLACEGITLSNMRENYIKNIQEEASNVYNDIAGGREKLQLEYLPCHDGDFFKTLQESRQKDIYAGFSTVGPHREDFKILINGKDTKTFASQGQQRSAVLSLKLAEANMVEKQNGEHPIMLLDDVLSELDEGRQSYLLNRMFEKQTIVTTCDANLFKKTNGKLVNMQNGVLTE